MRANYTTLPTTTTTSTTLLLAALIGCAGPTAAEGSSASAPIDVVGAVASGLSERPHNPRCVASPSAQMPQQLSQLGCFDAADVTQPGPGLVPYDVNAPLWSDDAEKQRWLAIPDGERISIDEAGHFVMPKGAVLLKTFTRAGQRLETRVWMNDPDAGWLGYSYRWATNGSDASLAGDAAEQIPLGDGAELWTIPARGQCSQCHQPGPNHNLGLHIAQFDRDFVYPSTGRNANQLATLMAVGLLAPDRKLDDSQVKLVDYRDAAQPIASRARSYLHANCSSCHASAEGYCTGDFRIAASGAQMGVCDVAPRSIELSWGWPVGTKLIAPGDPESSALWLRLSAPSDAVVAMPPLGRHEVDQQGVELIAAWITAMRSCEK